ncbi:MAG: ABC transporter substrate-binding protein [Bacillota bacterium]
MKRRFGVAVTCFVLAVSLLAGCASSGTSGKTEPSGGGAPPPAAKQERGEIRIAMQYDLGNLDPQVLTSVTDKQMTVNLYNGLVRYKLGTVEVEPDLAEKWDRNNAGTEWTFYLRKGVNFHRGYGEVKASDVKFTFDRLLDPALKSPNAALLKGLKTEVVNDHTVKFTLAKADAAFLDKLANSFSMIVSEKAVKEKGDKFSQNPIGTGPYMFDKWSPQQETVYVANDEYFRGKPGLARVVYVPIPDATTMYNAFEAGDVDLMQVTNPDKLAQYKGNPDLAINQTPGLITRFMGMNSKIKPFDDKRVRLAVIHAINKPFILEHALKGISTPAKAILAPAVMHSEQNVTQYAYDPAKAKQLLKEAGYADGFSTTFYVPNIDRFTVPATVIQENLAQVGIKAEIKVMETQAFLAALKAPEGLPMFTLSRGQDATPDRVLYTWHHKSGIPANNWANIDIPEVNEWLDAASKTVDENVRKDLFSKVQKRIVDEAFYFYLDHENHIYALNKRVKGFVGDPQRSIRLDNVTVGK